MCRRESWSMAASVGGRMVSTVPAAMQEINSQGVWGCCHTHLGAAGQRSHRRITSALDPEQTRLPSRLENDGSFHHHLSSVYARHMRALERIRELVDQPSQES